MPDDTVQKMYEDFPYPNRNPEDEKTRLIQSPSADIDYINALFWGGKKQIDKNFRVLDAGCGTGDIVIFLAEQLKDTKAEIVALDFSKSTLDIVQKRANIRGLKNIRFLHDSLLNIPKLDLGKFDCVFCTSVLPHLETPEEGLKILVNSLKSDGGLVLQVYGEYGRFPNHLLQLIAEKINKNEKKISKKLDDVGEIVKILPPWHIVRALLSKEDVSGDSALKYDVVLNSNTKPYTVPKLYKFLESANLKMVKYTNQIFYDPAFYTRGKFPEISGFSKPEQEELGELLHGKMVKHRFFAAKKDYDVPVLEPTNEMLIPCWVGKKLEVETPGEGQVITCGINRIGVGNIVFKIDKTRIDLINLVDGKRSISEILETTAKKTNVDVEKVRNAWLDVYKILSGVDMLALKLP